MQAIRQAAQQQLIEEAPLTFTGDKL